MLDVILSDRDSWSVISNHVAAYVREGFEVTISLKQEKTSWFWHFGDCLHNEYVDHTKLATPRQKLEQAVRNAGGNPKHHIFCSFE